MTIMGQVKPGDLLAGRYRIEAPLGSGGHANVFLAYQEKLDRKVAIKILKTSEGDEFIPDHKSEILHKRFEQEAKLISQLRDPRTITMYDYGATSDGTLYMVTEYVEGRSLKEVLAKEGAIHQDRVLRILDQLLLSIQEAHALGVLHRDIKPDNIMLYEHLGRRDQIKLLDFGIAKIVGDTDVDLTAENSIVGTPRYIAPERIRGEELAPSSDLYSLGLVTYEMLTGRRVLEGLKGIRALQSQLSDPSTELPQDLAIDPRIRALVNKLMRKEPSMRYRVAQQVLDELAPLIQQSGQHASVSPSRRSTYQESDHSAERAASPASASSEFAEHDRTERLDAMRVLVPGETPEEVARAKREAELDRERKRREREAAAPTPKQQPVPGSAKEVARQKKHAAQQKKRRERMLLGALIGALAIAILTAALFITYLVVNT